MSNSHSFARPTVSAEPPIDPNLSPAPRSDPATIELAHSQPLGNVLSSARGGCNVNPSPSSKSQTVVNSTPTGDAGVHTKTDHPAHQHQNHSTNVFDSINFTPPCQVPLSSRVIHNVLPLNASQSNNLPTHLPLRDPRENIIYDSIGNIELEQPYSPEWMLATMPTLASAGTERCWQDLVKAWINLRRDWDFRR